MINQKVYNMIFKKIFDDGHVSSIQLIDFVRKSVDEHECRNTELAQILEKISENPNISIASIGEEYDNSMAIEYWWCGPDKETYSAQFSPKTKIIECFSSICDQLEEKSMTILDIHKYIRAYIPGITNTEVLDIIGFLRCHKGIRVTKEEKNCTITELFEWIGYNRN